MLFETKKCIVYSKVGGAIGSPGTARKIENKKLSSSTSNYFGNKLSVSSVGPQIDMLSTTHTGDLNNTEYFRTKNTLLKKRVQELVEDNKKLRVQNEELMRLNIEYSNKITDVSLGKEEKVERISLKKADIDALSVPENTKEFISKLKNNKEKLEKDQLSLISYCKTLTFDNRFMKSKIDHAEALLETLKNEGHVSVEDLVNKLKDQISINLENQQRIKNLEIEINFKNDNIARMDKNVEEIKNAYLNVNEKHEALIVKYNREKCENKEKVLELRKYIDEMETKSNYLEDEMRKLQDKFHRKNQEFHSDVLLIQELEKENKQLKTSATSASLMQSMQRTVLGPTTPSALKKSDSFDLKRNSLSKSILKKPVFK